MARRRVKEFSDVRACCSTHLAGDRALKAARFALNESPCNRPPDAVMAALFSVGLLPPPGETAASVFAPAAIHLIGKTWEAGRTIGVGFLDGSARQKKKVQRWAEDLLQHANLTLDFSASSPDVRISMRGPGSASFIGTDCRGVRSGPTMWFGWVDDASDDVADRAVIQHEFCHMLGLGHEQSNPHCNIHWDRPKALDYYMRTQGWSRQMVEDNVFSVYAAEQVSDRTYDPNSIMQYPVPAELTLDGVGVGWNTELTAQDVYELGVMYPGHAPIPVPPPPPPPPVESLPEIVIGHPAARASIPVAGSPARFTLSVPRHVVLELAVSVERSGGMPPRVVILPEGKSPVVLPVPRGRGLFAFEAGKYELDVFHPFPRRTGAVMAKVSPRA